MNFKILLALGIMASFTSGHCQLPSSAQETGSHSINLPLLKIPKRPDLKITILPDPEKKVIIRRSRNEENEASDDSSTECNAGCGTCICSICSVIALFLCCAYCPCK